MKQIDLYEMFGVDQVTQVQSRLSEDAAFRAEALADLNDAVLRHYGITLPLRLAVVETEEGFKVLAPVEADALSEDELDLVAGGGAQQCDSNRVGSKLRT